MEKTIKNNQNMVITILVAIIFAGIGFFVGTKYQQSQLTNQRSQFMDQFGGRNRNDNKDSTGRGLNGDGFGRMGGFRGGQIFGDIIDVDEKSVTVKLSDGSSKIILFSDTTSIRRGVDASVSDLKIGDKVVTFGNTNTDGSISAQNIEINPAMPNRQNQPTVTPVK